MSWPETTRNAIYSLQSIARELDSAFVGREHAARLLPLACVCREHVLLLGPPGTAKTNLISLFANLVSANQFSYLLTRFTEPSEIFGPLDFELFKQGTYHIQTQGMLPEAEIVFLDEVFQGSSAILNTLLTVINERQFHNGGDRQDAKLVSLFGASSDMPEDPLLRAFGDRFLLRMNVEPVARTNLSELLDRGWQLERLRIGQDPATRTGLISIAAINDLSRQIRHVDITGIRDTYAELITDLLSQGVRFSDRRVVRGLKLVAGAALLREAQQARARDFWPLHHIWTEPGDDDIIRSVVGEYVENDGGEPLLERDSAAVLVARARQVTQQLAGRAGPVNPRSIMASLRTLSDIRLKLLQHHGFDQAAIATVQDLIDNTTERLSAAS